MRGLALNSFSYTGCSPAWRSSFGWPGQAADPGEVPKLCKSCYFSGHPAPRSSAPLLGRTARLCMGILVRVGGFLPTSRNSLHSGGVQDVARVHVRGCARSTRVVPFTREKDFTFLQQLCAPSPLTRSRERVLGTGTCDTKDLAKWEAVHLP